MCCFARCLSIFGCGVVLGLSALPGQAQTYTDPLTAPLSGTYWALGQSVAGVYSYSYSSSGLHFQKVGTVTERLEYIGASLKLSAVNAANAADFDTKVTFTGAKLGPTQVDQIQLNAFFTDNSIFLGVCDNSGAGGALNVHVWDGTEHNPTPISGNGGTMELRRHNGQISFLFNGATIWTKTVTVPLASIQFVLQNNLNSNDSIAVTYSNFSFSAVPIAFITGRLQFDGLVTYAPSQSVAFTLRPTDGSAEITQNALVPPAGGFQIMASKKDYVLHIKGARYLAANVSVDATKGDVAGVKAELSAGDANNDNYCDATDFGLFVSAYNSDASVPGSGYDVVADFNGDGSVDATDFGLFVGSYNQQGDP